MNISPLMIYLWQLADEAKCFSFGIAICMLVVLIISAIVVGDKIIEDWKSVQLRVKAFFGASILLIFFSVLIPTSKTIAMMVIIPEIAHSKVVQQDLPDIYNAAVKSLKDQLSK